MWTNAFYREFHEMLECLWLDLKQLKFLCFSIEILPKISKRCMIRIIKNLQKVYNMAVKNLKKVSLPSTQTHETPDFVEFAKPHFATDVIDVLHLIGIVRDMTDGEFCIGIDG